MGSSRLKFLLCLGFLATLTLGFSSQGAYYQGISIERQFCGTYKLTCNYTGRPSPPTLIWSFGDGSSNDTVTYYSTTSSERSVMHSFLTTGSVLVTVSQGNTIIYSSTFNVFSVSQSAFLNTASIGVSGNPNGTVNVTYQGSTFFNSDSMTHFFTVSSYSPSIPDLVIHPVSPGGSLTSGDTLVKNYSLGLSGESIVSFSIYQSIVYGSDTISCYLDGVRVVIQAPIVPPAPPCCINFAPESGKRYWVSAWVKEGLSNQVKSYEKSSVRIKFVGSIDQFVFRPSGEIIDGWQKVVGEFIVPDNVSEMQVSLKNEHSGEVDVFFDDIRIHPFNASMKSYVYDPKTLWLVAELDDNNYATFYEYDYEGQLIRIKKETSRGIRTIQESRSSNPKNGQ